MAGGTPQREGLFTAMPQPPLTLLWETDTGLKLTGSVLTDGQKLYMVGNAASNGKFLCLDWQTGQIDWQADFGGKCQTTPVIADNKITVASTDGRIYGVGIDGKSAFSIRTMFATCSAIDPLDTGESVIYGMETYGAGLFAVNPATGQKQWDFTRSTSSYVNSDPCADAGHVFVSYNDDILVSFDQSNRQVTWEKEIKEGVFGGLMALSGKIIFPTKKGISAVLAENGEPAWNAVIPDTGHRRSTPATDGRLVYICTTNGVHAIESMTGEVIWSQTFDGQLSDSSTPSVGSGLLCAHDGTTCFILDAETGKMFGKFKINAKNNQSITIGQPLVIWDRIIFPTSEGKVICWGLLGEQPPDPEPDPEPEPPTPSIKSTLRIVAPEKAKLNDIVEIEVQLLNASKWTRGEFVFVFDNTKLEFAGVKPGEFLSRQNVPIEVKAEPNELGVKITASIAKIDGVTGDGTLVWVALKPKTTGVHNLTIIDAKMTDTSNVSHDPNIEPDSFIVEDETVEPPPPPPPPPPPDPEMELYLDPPNIDLGILTTSRSLTLRLTQKNGVKNNFVVRSSGEYGVFYPANGQIQPNSSQEIRVTVDPKDLKPGDYDLVISVNITDKTLKTTIKFKIPSNPIPETPSCIDILPAFLDFGYIPRGREVSISFTIMFDSDTEMSGVIESDKEWLKVSPVVFKTRLKRLDGIATISASELPGGDSFEGHLTIKSKNNICKEVKVLAKVQTQPSIILEMDVGVAKARIASLTVPLDSPPFIRNSRTLVPIRFVSEAFGCKVQWEASSKKITISRFTDSITLWIGQKQALVNGMEVSLDVAPSLENSTTFVPIRFISEAFGAKVEWFGETKHIKITYTPPQEFRP
jgi:outer membrane protein assembly factor BamB